MPVAFLIVSAIGLLFTINAFRPLRAEVFALPAFFAGWLTSELPVHHLLWQVVATALFVAAGALNDWPGLVGLALAAMLFGAAVTWTLVSGRLKKISVRRFFK